MQCYQLRGEGKEEGLSKKYVDVFGESTYIFFCVTDIIRNVNGFHCCYDDDDDDYDDDNSGHVVNYITICLRVSIAVKRHHDHSNFYKRKRSIECLRVSEV